MDVFYIEYPIYIYIYILHFTFNIYILHVSEKLVIARLALQYG